jgi:hypothetical protein
LKNCVFYRETSLENFLASQEWGGVWESEGILSFWSTNGVWNRTWLSGWERWMKKYMSDVSSWKYQMVGKGHRQTAQWNYSMQIRSTWRTQGKTGHINQPDTVT